MASGHEQSKQGHDQPVARVHANLPGWSRARHHDATVRDFASLALGQDLLVREVEAHNVMGKEIAAEKTLKKRGRDMSMVSNRQGPKFAPPRFNRLLVRLSSSASFACACCANLLLRRQRASVPPQSPKNCHPCRQLRVESEVSCRPIADARGASRYFPRLVIGRFIDPAPTKNGSSGTLSSMVKRGKQFDEVIRETARRKFRAAAARSGRVPDQGEAPRQVYMTACQVIADALANDGFEYARSRNALSRKTSDFGFHIHFQSSHHNVAGELVTMVIHAGVTSQALKTWRTAHPCLMGVSDAVAGGQIGNLVKPESWMEWNLASVKEREDEIADAVSTIRELAYPYFALFGDVVAVRARLVAEDVPSMWLASALDFLMCFGTRDEALALARRVFLQKEQIQERYRTSLAQYQTLGVPPHLLSAYGDVLAAATLSFGLPNVETLVPLTSVPVLRRPDLSIPKSLSKAEQRARRILSKGVAAELRARSKGTGWKVSQGWLFREDSGWFVEVRPIVHLAQRKSWLELRAKPMSIDPIFWDITETHDAAKLPLSFRVFGAFTVTTPAITGAEITEGSLDAGGLADAILRVAQSELERSRHDRSIEAFLAVMQEHHARLPSHPYLPAIVCALILLGRREDARTVCASASTAHESGGFVMGSRSFTDLAIAWLDNAAANTH